MRLDRWLWIFVAATTATLLADGTANAFHQSEYDKLELKCRSTIAKTLTKAISLGQKTVAGCHKGRDKTGAIVDCNVLDGANADAKGKFLKAQTKLTASMQKKCTDSGIDDDVLVEYTSCPEPCGTDLALPNPLSNYAEVGQCLACVAKEIAEEYGSSTLGLPSVPLPTNDQLCRKAIGKFYGKTLKTALKDRTKCQQSAEKGGATHLDTTGCLTADPKGKIATAIVKAEAGVDTSCAAATLATLGSCATTTLGDLKNCLDTETDEATDAGVMFSFELPATICPVAVSTITIAGSPTVGGPVGLTQLESGWNGIGHGQDIVHDYSTSLSVTCPGSSPPCGSCTIDGLDPTGQQYTAFTRCKQDATIPCSNPFGLDGVCPGTQECSYYLGPPAPLSASNTPTCGLFRLESDITGTVDPDTGAGDQNIDLRAVIHTGIALNKPCPVCVSDPVAKDGVRGGICDGGIRDGLACDVQGFDATFAAGVGNGVSLDCIPGALQNITGQGLALDLALTSGAVSLPFNTSCDFPLNAFDCACAVCSLDSAQACNSDAECALTGSGTCTSAGGGASRQPNDCSDLTCADMGGGVGACLAGPDVMACDGVVRANGDGYILCSNDSDCQVGAIGFDAGNCTQVQTRSCFLDPIDAVGAPDPNQTLLVAAFCVPPTTSSGVNSATGLPGPSRVSVELGLELDY